MDFTSVWVFSRVLLKLDNNGGDDVGVTEEEEEHPVATPSRHFASLQLSGQPMLVPETVEESL